jgi:hypothetical protein
MPAAVQIAVLGRTSKSKSLCLGNKNGKLVKSLRGLLRFHFAGAVKRGSTERRCLAEIVWQWCFSLAEDERKRVERERRKMRKIEPAAAQSLSLAGRRPARQREQLQGGGALLRDRRPLQLRQRGHCNKQSQLSVLYRAVEIHQNAWHCSTFFRNIVYGTVAKGCSKSRYCSTRRI